MTVWSVILQSLSAFVVLFIISKILGKKQISQLEFTDYVIGISIGSIAAAMATEPELPAYHFVIAMAVFGLLALFLSLISRKSEHLKSFFKGKPLIIIEEGKIIFENVVKSKLSINEIIAQCRNKGYFYIEDIAYCVFETSGDFSILPKSNNRPVVAEDLNIKEKPAEMQKEIIIDGKLRKSELEKINKTKEWVYKQLKIKDKKDLKNIFLAIYDDENNSLIVHYRKT